MSESDPIVYVRVWNTETDTVIGHTEIKLFNLITENEALDLVDQTEAESFEEDVTEALVLWERDHIVLAWQLRPWQGEEA